MNIKTVLLPFFLFMSIISSAQIDSIKKKDINKQGGKLKDSLIKKKSLPLKHNNLKLEKSKALKDSLTFHGGIGNTDISTLTNDTLKKLNNEIKLLEIEKKTLKQNIDNIKNEKANNSNLIIVKTLPVKKQEKRISWTLLLSLMTIAVCIIIFFIVLRSRRRPLKIPLAVNNNLHSNNMALVPKSNPEKPTSTAINQNIRPDIKTQPKSISNILSPLKKISQKNNSWLVVAATSIGKSHLVSNKPCQDNHLCEDIGNGWGIAVVCDGAGSAENSDLGSKFVCSEALQLFKAVIINNKFQKKAFLPSEVHWKEITLQTFNKIYRQLEKFASLNKIITTSAACTLIVVIHTPIGILTAHIGDGRAGFCNEDGDWKALMTPHKGEEANHTIFISSSAWQTRKDFTMSGVSVPESRVIRQKVIAFTLMSDGCEQHAFECSKMDTVTNLWHDPNIPSPKFFNPLIEKLKDMNETNMPLEEANLKWQKFLEEGNKLKDEPDDKTLILGIFI